MRKLASYLTDLCPPMHIIVLKVGYFVRKSICHIPRQKNAKKWWNQNWRMASAVFVVVAAVQNEVTIWLSGTGNIIMQLNPKKFTD